MPWSFNERPANVVAIFTSFIPGYRLVDAEDLLTMAHLLFSNKDNIVGGAGQEDAVPLETFISQVTSGGSVVLPPGLPGRYLYVLNDTSSTLQVFGIHSNILTGGDQDTIDGGIVAFLGPGTVGEYICYAPGKWRQFLGGGGGDGGGFPDAPVNGVTYGRLNGGWVPVLNLSTTNPQTMQGPLILAPGTPNNINQAVSLGFVQNMHIDEGTY